MSAVMLKTLNPILTIIAIKITNLKLKKNNMEYYNFFGFKAHK